MLQFLPLPGPRERQLQRKVNNPLFSSAAQISQAELEQARIEDQKEFEEFLVEFRALVEQAATLDGRADADDILALKARIEQFYPRACGVAGDTNVFKSSLQKLLVVISQALLNASDNDPEALSRINEDREKSELHMRISEFPVVSDLLSEKEIIPATELPTILLGESEDATAAALLIFSPEQLQSIIESATEIVASHAEVCRQNPDIQKRLAQLKKWHTELSKK